MRAYRRNVFSKVVARRTTFYGLEVWYGSCRIAETSIQILQHWERSAAIDSSIDLFLRERGRPFRTNSAHLKVVDSSPSKN